MAKPGKGRAGQAGPQRPVLCDRQVSDSREDTLRPSNRAVPGPWPNGGGRAGHRGRLPRAQPPISGRSEAAGTPPRHVRS